MEKLFSENLTKSEKFINKKIFEKMDDFDKVTITSLAQECYVSEAMIVKYCKKIGFSGFKELKYYVIENNKKVDTNPKYVQFQQDKINDFFELINKNPELIKNLAKEISKSQYVILYGLGPSLGVAKYFASKLINATKKPVIVQSDEQIMDIEITTYNENRLFLFLTASMQTKEILDKLEKIERTNNKYFVICEDVNYDFCTSNIIKLSDKINYKYTYEEIRDRTLFFIYLELIVNELMNM